MAGTICCLSVADGTTSEWKTVGSGFISKGIGAPTAELQFTPSARSSESSSHQILQQDLFVDNAHRVRDLDLEGGKEELENMFKGVVPIPMLRNLRLQWRETIENTESDVFSAPSFIFEEGASELCQVHLREQ
ncbi:hypothetical protein C8J56DRAFT_1029825 [Mycena floridula]|nr:hypothetical protein C8J56DRAFT_1029825 [Mycena floridula]